MKEKCIMFWIFLEKTPMPHRINKLKGRCLIWHSEKEISPEKLPELT
jgi:hypothetical protein